MEGKWSLETFMNIECPKCKQWFELSSESFNNERFNVSEYLICSKCGYMLPSLEFVGEARWGEFMDWINDYNHEIIVNRSGRVWEVIVYDRDLRNQLVRENVLSPSSGDPSIRFLIKCVEPDKLFILKKFKSYLVETYKHGYVNPIIQIRPGVASPHETCINLL